MDLTNSAAVSFASLFLFKSKKEIVSELLKRLVNFTYDFIFNFSGNIDHKKNKETFDVHFKGIKNLVRIIPYFLT